MLNSLLTDSFDKVCTDSLSVVFLKSSSTMFMGCTFYIIVFELKFIHPCTILEPLFFLGGIAGIMIDCSTNKSINLTTENNYREL